MDDRPVYGGRIDAKSLDQDWSDPNNKWWLDNEEIEVIDFEVDTSGPDLDITPENIFVNPDKMFALINDKQPLHWARTFLVDCFYHADMTTLIKWRDEIYIWRSGAWRRASKDQIQKAAFFWGERCMLVNPDNGNQKAFNVNKAKVGEIIFAASSISAIDDEQHQPSLLGPLEINPSMAVSMRNGIVDLRNGTLLPPSPRFFSSSCNKFDFDKSAPKPKLWLKFLEQIWGDDTESIEALQEVFGYLLTSDTAMQKAFMLIGPKRSGKGTIARVLGEMIGHDAMAAPTLASLSNNFGLAPLIGKKLALIADARLSTKADNAVIAERILSITGEDTQTIDRKHLAMWNGKLFSRFLIMSNILPKFIDSSGALTSRMIILKMTNSFFGKEDPHLFERMKSELPGIFVWALDGLERLRNRGRFVNPTSSLDMVEDLADMASPMSEFLRNECEVGLDFEVSRKAIYDEWKIWCGNNGYREGSMGSFGAALHSVLPSISTKRPKQRETGGNINRERKYLGIRLRITI